MLGSAAVPWFYGAMAPFQNEDSLTTAYIAAGLALSVVAYDYQVHHNDRVYLQANMHIQFKACVVCLMSLVSFDRRLEHW